MTGVRLDARTIPVPTSISVEAQAALARMVDAAGVPLNARHVMPAPDDDAAWIALRDTADAHYAALLADMATPPRATAETVRFGSATVHVATPAEPCPADRVYLDLHGGALVLGGGAACRHGARTQAARLGIACWAIDYRMPPEHPYPAGLDDSLAVYRAALDRFVPENIVIGGRSAGGNLAAALLLRARDQGLPMPAGLVLLSPQVDLTESGDSFAVNRTIDVVLPNSLMANNLLYAAGADLTHPHLSPLFGDVSGFPPTFLLSGTRDLFLSNTVRMHRALRRAGVAAELHVFEAMPHGGFMGAPEDQEATGETISFVRQRLGMSDCASGRTRPG